VLELHHSLQHPGGTGVRAEGRQRTRPGGGQSSRPDGPGDGKTERRSAGSLALLDKARFPEVSSASSSRGARANPRQDLGEIDVGSEYKGGGQPGDRAGATQDGQAISARRAGPPRKGGGPAASPVQIRVFGDNRISSAVRRKGPAGLAAVRRSLDVSNSLSSYGGGDDPPRTWPDCARSRGDGPAGSGRPCGWRTGPTVDEKWLSNPEGERCAG